MASAGAPPAAPRPAMPVVAEALMAEVCAFVRLAIDASSGFATLAAMTSVPLAPAAMVPTAAPLEPTVNVYGFVPVGVIGDPLSVALENARPAGSVSTIVAPVAAVEPLVLANESV